MRRTLAVAAVVALGLAACSSGDEPQAAPSSASPSPTRAALVTHVAEPVVRVANPSAVIGAPPADTDPELAATAAAAVAEAVEAAAIAVIEGGGTPSLPGDPALTGPAVDLLDVLDRADDPVIDVNLTTVADAAPGGVLVTVTLDALTTEEEPIVIELAFTISPEGDPFLAVAEVTEAPAAPAPAPTPTTGGDGTGTEEPTEAATEEAS